MFLEQNISLLKVVAISKADKIRRRIIVFLIQLL